MGPACGPLETSGTKFLTAPSTESTLWTVEMRDIYSDMAALGRELEAVDARIAEAVAQLKAERAEIQAKMAKLAKSMAADGIPDSDESREPAEAPRKLAPRQLQLLKLLADKPGADLGHLAEEMFGVNDAIKRKGLSAMFSELKPLGLATSPELGRFELTAAGLRAIGRQPAKAANH